MCRSYNRADTFLAGPGTSIGELDPEDDPFTIEQTGFFKTETLTNATPSSLTNAVHPMLSRKKFPASKFDYDNMEQSMRLLTHMIEGALPVFHTFLCQSPRKIDRKDIGEDAQEGKSYFAFPEPLDKLTNKQKQAAWVKLEALGETIIFDIISESSINGSCVSDLTTQGSLGAGLKGCASNIYIAEHLYNNVINSTKNRDDVVSQQFWAFHLADTLLHELGHAAVRAGSSLACDVNAYFFLGDNASSEMGYELTSWLFGGVIFEANWPTGGSYFNEKTGKHSPFERAFTATEWPSTAKKHSYSEDSIPLVFKDNVVPLDVVWNVPFKHFNQMFQDSFWETDVARLGRSALWMPREIGYRFLPIEGALVSFSLETERQIGTTSGLGIPEGYMLDRKGVLRRNVPKSEMGERQPRRLRDELKFLSGLVAQRFKERLKLEPY